MRCATRDGGPRKRTVGYAEEADRAKRFNGSASGCPAVSPGDLGYSIGTLEVTVNDAEGNPVTRGGKYTTVWRKQKDGQWKVVSDMFNFNSPAPTGEG